MTAIDQKLIYEVREEKKMKENEKNKREWVKTAAIIFLSVMLVLTFFSQSIMNYSLPEVATSYAQSGTITAQPRNSRKQSVFHDP